MRGRKPIPKHLRIITGADSKRRPRTRLPTSYPSVPDFLDKEARREWKRITHELAAVGLLTRLDRGLLAIWCTAWSDLARSRRIIAEQGPTTTTATGYVQTRSEVGIARTAAQTLLRIGPELGLSPISRTRLELQPLLPIPRPPADGKPPELTTEETAAIERRFFGK